jgi:hypothetical protein
MDDMLNLYSELYSVHRAAHYKFKSDPKLNKSYGEADLRKFVPVDKKIFARLLNEDLQFDKQVLKELL